jgi:hypothetical protein
MSDKAAVRGGTESKRERKKESERERGTKRGMSLDI